MAVRYIESSKLPTPWGVFDIHGFEDAETGKEHVVLSLGDIGDGQPVLARIHSECLTGDALFSMRCDCGAQLQAAIQKVAEEGRGAIFYLRQEGRGIGLMNKIRAYKLQDEGADTVEANEQLGFGADMRDYSLLKPMCEQLNIHKVRLMTNNPRKVNALTDQGVDVVERLPLQTGQNPHNAKYLATKSGKLGHLF
ncbi:MULTISPECIES: GTP cyclohydrolase II [Spongiibacter]|uniref:GTP cyclohydrolase II n=1 Tax=Spongiibacter sp. TaxID=2024860 RepID=UPI00048B4695|nr:MULTISPECIES: GTP cyclohydrolase II [Spongiibacter]MAY38794.1 GTP cyclohydrolase II [Spongiibacter sp.]MBI57092.1 GTP cyclohydrolase II [Spongiibacter sp.]MBO6753132.1 GTP cyclohydrolase II [Spongiibacter sp.]MBU72488.1 GTP cyclohydrolase II [Spongiibacter sp.]